MFITKKRFENLQKEIARTQEQINLLKNEVKGDTSESVKNKSGWNNDLGFTIFMPILKRGLIKRTEELENKIELLEKYLNVKLVEEKEKEYYRINKKK